ncbi:hypothetical protein NQ176_g7769 [Zarea fungicola]|uniref:Uncharacterized protein n=1 Tax=Zarea fungicola TaxID=93591 RepID=A0ACC1MXA1_9HYPO|nr:hypothetical protein NQ176_g7769 [Lecanicillium fungicola]
MFLHAGGMLMLMASAAAAHGSDLARHSPDITVGGMIAVPAASPAIPTLTGDVEQDVQLIADDLHAPMPVTYFTRQLDLVKRDPNPVQETSDMLDRRASSDVGSDAGATPITGSSTMLSPRKPSSTTDVPSSSSDATSSPLPSPFDDAPSSIFKSPSSTTDACPTFMKTLLNDPTFKKCYPLSMMLQTSNSFFQAEKQLVSIVRVLDATCAADVNKCDQFLTQAAKNLLDASNCKKEYDSNQGQVIAAFDGLRAYKTLYAVTCLQNPQTQNYCFASAVTNVTNPSDIFFYSMPLGLPLPTSTTPSCGWCTSQTMAIFHAASSDRSQKISSTYKDAARQVNTICGPGFVNDTATSGAARLSIAQDAASTFATVLFAAVAAFMVMAW